jgi:hypothetical protein
MKKRLRALARSQTERSKGEPNEPAAEEFGQNLGRILKRVHSGPIIEWWSTTNQAGQFLGMCPKSPAGQPGRRGMGRTEV